MISIKLILGIVAAIIAIFCFIPYIRDIFKKTTAPHSYSWLVWTLLQGTGTIAVIVGDGGYAALGIGIGTVFCLFIFLLSIKLGTKNITKFDVVCLIGAILAIVVWIFTKDALFAVILVTIIDFVGFLPTYRKGYQEPHTETALTYFLSGLSSALALFAVSTYSITTSLYLGSLVFSNWLCVSILLYRRSMKKEK